MFPLLNNWTAASADSGPIRVAIQPDSFAKGARVNVPQGLPSPAALDGNAVAASRFVPPLARDATNRNSAMAFLYRNVAALFRNAAFLASGAPFRFNDAAFLFSATAFLDSAAAFLFRFVAFLARFIAFLFRNVTFLTNGAPFLSSAATFPEGTPSFSTFVHPELFNSTLNRKGNQTWHTPKQS